MRLPEHTIDVWRADLATGPDGAWTLIDDAERVRAQRFRFPADRERWVRGRATLRMLLGRYLEVAPAEVQLVTGVAGKLAAVPALVSFNLAHAGDLALYAFAREAEVGIDVELAGRKVDVLAAAQRVLGPDTAVRLAGLPQSAREAAFLAAWVRHEAAAKCRGGGLAAPVDLAGLSIVELPVGPGAAAALAIAGEPRRVCLRDVSAGRVAGGFAGATTR